MIYRVIQNKQIDVPNTPPIHGESKYLLVSARCRNDIYMATWHKRHKGRVKIHSTSDDRKLLETCMNLLKCGNK